MGGQMGLDLGGAEPIISAPGDAGGKLLDLAGLTDLLPDSTETAWVERVFLIVVGQQLLARRAQFELDCVAGCYYCGEAGGKSAYLPAVQSDPKDPGSIFEHRMRHTPKGKPGVAVVCDSSAQRIVWLEHHPEAVQHETVEALDTDLWAGGFGPGDT